MSETPKNVNYGGQAVIEGVMMRGSKAVAVASRNPNGEIVIHTEPLNQKIYSNRLFKTPIARGLLLLWDALGLGTKALLWSAEIAMPEEENEDGTTSSDVFSTPAKIGTILLSLCMSIGLFFMLPAFVGDLSMDYIPGDHPQFWSHLVEGVFKLALLIGYVSILGLTEDMKRVYGYHGAEHKTINAYEGGSELTPEKVAKFPIEHPRCGTAFLLTLMVISILLFTMIDLEKIAPYFWDNMLIARFVTRLLLIPVVAGTAYEFLRFSAKYSENPIIKLITIPNLALQHLTTREPDETMLEVAIASFNQMMSYEKGTASASDEDLILAPSARYQAFQQKANG